ncbi:putative siderophore-binding lipoprotein YfiY [Paenibacillus polymyxa]|jgi:iron complex transport system substrate-binding protein|uniref:ABC transporter substrate-binding protein n=1 Tax=Paenibacillus polymyxa TaxID=1406 RepID=UPI000947485B|nr:iron-siderophore ABC transporter substrate-binding protein [Paenibacillus polymyxa]APQ58128.1 iron ABC transporter substrate-binding protein [Paenibacillus polymyxa]VUG08273.1 putative siderophore-binding lipoprotein YfiY [Paenibacillus polymyxa]
MFGLTKKLHIYIALILMISVLAGCASGGTSGTTDPSSKSASGNKSNAAGSGADEQTRVIKHAMGETTIKGTPKRIVTLFQGANDVVVALGVKPTGVVESWVQQPVYKYLKADLDGVTQVGQESQPNLEEINKLKPDLIIATKTRHEDIYDQLSQIAPTVVTETLFDWKETVKTAGEAMNMKEQSDKLLADWDARVADFKDKMGDRLPIEATITNFRADQVRIFYMGYAGKILKELGFTRPPGHDEDTWGVELTSKENIPDMNADMIFNFNSGTETEAIEKNYKDWTSSPLWKNLDAVKNNQLVQVDEVAWNMGGGYTSANMMLDDLYKQFNLN